MLLWLTLISTVPLDKAAHFGVSVALNVACYESAKTLTDSKAGSLIGCSIFTGTVGALKEVSDSSMPGNYFSKGDLAADLLGVGFSAAFLSLDF